VVLRAN